MDQTERPQSNQVGNRDSERLETDSIVTQQEDGDVVRDYDTAFNPGMIISKDILVGKNHILKEEGSRDLSEDEIRVTDRVAEDSARRRSVTRAEDRTPVHKPNKMNATTGISFGQSMHKTAATS